MVWKLSSILLLSLSLNSCNGTLPLWEGKIWDGSAARGGIQRTQANEFIAANDPLFDSYMAMSYDDFRSFYQTYVLGCKEWYPHTPMMTVGEAVKLLPPEMETK